jgi:hypothetical protein
MVLDFSDLKDFNDLKYLRNFIVLSIPHGLKTLKPLDLKTL